MLVINNLSKSFHGKQVLHDVSFTVKKGEIAFLLGSSGVGKSTILRVLNNLETPNSGNIVLDGVPLNLAQVNKNHHVGMVFQHFNLFDHLTVQENIILPLELTLKKTPQEAHARAHELLEQYGLADKANSYVARLSGGQKQRIAIARAVALEPKIICLDEPTSALDPFLTNYVAANIQQLADQGYFVLVASHDIGLLEKLNCTIHLMAHGTIIESALSQEFKINAQQFPSIEKFVHGK